MDIQFLPRSASTVLDKRRPVEAALRKLQPGQIIVITNRHNCISIRDDLQRGGIDARVTPAPDNEWTVLVEQSQYRASYDLV
jgi:hypothetical protein